MFDFRRITLFGLGYHPSKHKMIIRSKNWGGMAPLPPLAAPMTHARSFACRSRLQNLRADCFAVGLYCVTITWQEIF